MGPEIDSKAARWDVGTRGYRGSPPDGRWKSDGRAACVRDEQPDAFLRLRERGACDGHQRERADNPQRNHSLTLRRAAQYFFMRSDAARR